MVPAYVMYVSASATLGPNIASIAIDAVEAIPAFGNPAFRFGGCARGRKFSTGDALVMCERPSM
jgi:hypothetical protein